MDICLPYDGSSGGSGGGSDDGNESGSLGGRGGIHHSCRENERGARLCGVCVADSNADVNGDYRFL